MRIADPFGFTSAINMKALDVASPSKKKKVMKIFGLKSKKKDKFLYRQYGDKAFADWYETPTGHTYQKVFKFKK